MYAQRSIPNVLKSWTGNSKAPSPSLEITFSWIWSYCVAANVNFETRGCIFFLNDSQRYMLIVFPFIVDRLFLAFGPAVGLHFKQNIISHTKTSGQRPSQTLRIST